MVVLPAPGSPLSCVLACTFNVSFRPTKSGGCVSGHHQNAVHISRPSSFSSPHRLHSQKKRRLILLPAAQSRPHFARKLLRGAHGAALLLAIGAFGGICVRVNGDIALRRDAGNGQMAVETRRNVTGNVCIAQVAGRQPCQILLVRRGRHVCGAAASWPMMPLQLQLRQASRGRDVGIGGGGGVDVVVGECVMLQYY